MPPHLCIDGSGQNLGCFFSGTLHLVVFIKINGLSEVLIFQEHDSQKFDADA